MEQLGPLARRARRHGAPPDDPRRKDPDGSRGRVGRSACRRSHSGPLQLRRRLHGWHRPPRDPRHQSRRLRRRRPHGRLPGTLRDPAPFDARRGLVLGPELRLPLRVRDWPRTACARIQYVHRRWCEHHSRTPQRPQLRVRRRRSRSGWNHDRPTRKGRPVAARDERHQALRLQRSGDRPHQSQRPARPQSHARVRPARLRSRHRHRRPVRRHVLL